MDLSGTWAFELDPEDRGLAEGWHTRALADSIRLPGCLQAQGYGSEIAVDTPWTGNIHYQAWFTEARYERYRQNGDVKVPFWLQPDKHYIGAAWYQREVIIPETWAGQRATLTLERPHWETQVWLDDRNLGSADSLSTPHVYDLGIDLAPGLHRVTIRVHNRLIVNVGPNAHSVSDHTQTNWNGIVGRIELAAGSAVWIDDVQVYPDVANRAARVRITLGNASGQPATGWLQLRAALPGQEALPVLEPVDVEIGAEGAAIEVDYWLGSEARLWDEFDPAVYELETELTATVGSRTYADHHTTQFGVREVGVDGTQLSINGRKIFLRGTLECCVFPLTGYPPTEVEPWKRIIRICQAHGLNHIRFHSWCPPKAAFVAADELGFYYQVECSAWANQGASLGEGDSLDEWLYAEGRRLTREYGNHPSFLLMAYGNEPAGRIEGYLTEWVNYWKREDPRRLHTTAAGWPIIPESDYHSSPEPRSHQWGDGLRARLNAYPPETWTDYRDFVQKLDAPVVSHEIGQFCAYPNFAEMPKYTGHLKPRNMEIFCESLNQHHMADQAQAFLMASGRLQVACYKEDIESALRTPGFAGFQLLGLNDFPGQGTALVGVLDAFWDSKGYVCPDEFRRFCNSTVLLARLARRTWRTSETLSAVIEIAHFGREPLVQVSAAWSLVDDTGTAVAAGSLPSARVAIGNGQRLGAITVPLAGLGPGRRYRLVVGLPGTAFENVWDVWVFADYLDTTPPDDVLITETMDASALRRLGSGGKVLFMPRAVTVNTTCQLGFSSVFWNTAWTDDQPPHTLGLVCDPKHPVFADFPTEDHSNWHWWELVRDAAAMTLDHLPAALRPLVQPIDTWFENRRLGLLFEARVNGGRLMVCSMNLRTGLESRLVARQMRHSLLRYMCSDAFLPQTDVELQAIGALIRLP
jgi:hypothetical protein